MKRIILINAHCNDLLMSTMNYFLFKNKVPCKYLLLVKELALNESISITNLVTENGIYIKPRYLNVRLPKWIEKIIAKRESKYVLKKNGLLNMISTTTDFTSVKDEDIVLGFIHSKFGYDHIRELRGEKYLHINQYYCYKWEELNNILPFCNNYLLEANVFAPGNYVMNAKLADNYKFHLLPFVVQDRFHNTNDFSLRKNVALANGTIGPCKQPDYLNFYHTNLIHKMRQIIYDHKNELSDLMDVTISPYIEKKPKFPVNEDDSSICRLFKSIMNHFFFNTHGQSKYFSLDLVSVYNNYKMAIVPEEICGIPGIGAFEAMACGCALIGLKHHMYTDLGLIPNVHYITYDGSLEDLKIVISYYQEHPKELEEIAKNGELFVLENFRKESIAKKFISIIE